MENPCLTFLTPSLLVGDKSLTEVIAHEISHSWTGNLVTNSNWQDFWLNEGFTMYLERKIIGKTQGEKARHFSALIGLGELKEAIKGFGGPEHPFTSLVPDLKGSHPDDAYSVIPYEKGHTLLFYMETIVGVDAMDSYLKAYIAEYARKSLTTKEWLAFTLSFFCVKYAFKVPEPFECPNQTTGLFLDLAKTAVSMAKKSSDSSLK